MKLIFDIKNLTHEQSRVIRQAAADPSTQIQVTGYATEQQQALSPEAIRCDGISIEIDSRRHGKMSFTPDAGNARPQLVEPVAQRMSGHFRIDDDSPPRYRIRQRDESKSPDPRPLARLPSWAR